MTYVPNSLNQYDSVGGVSYAYDGNGNLSSDGRNAYTYDEENRLTTLVNAQHSTQYEYDAFNRRVSKKVDGLGTDFIYDGFEDIAEYNASGQLQAEYVYGDSIDEVLVMSRAGKNYYYHYDGLGSVSDLTDSSGNVVESYTYGVYGRPSQVSSVGNPFMFTGRRFDDESGLYYYRLRMYSPTIGRFLQRDPIGYYDSMNLFEYCFNNPTNWVDPWGEYVWALPWVVPALEDLITVGVGLYLWYLSQKYGAPSLPSSMSGSGTNANTCPIQHQSDDFDINNPKYPGNDPNKSPGEDWEWKGKGTPESGEGNWYNPNTGESLHPDLNHPPPKPPHWGYSGPQGKGDIYEDGTIKWK